MFPLVHVPVLFVLLVVFAVVRTAPVALGLSFFSLLLASPWSPSGDWRGRYARVPRLALHSPDCKAFNFPLRSFYYDICPFSCCAHVAISH